MDGEDPPDAALLVDARPGAAGDEDHSPHLQMRLRLRRKEVRCGIRGSGSGSCGSCGSCGCTADWSCRGRAGGRHCIGGGHHGGAVCRRQVKYC